MAAVMFPAIALALNPRVAQLRPMMIDANGRNQTLCLEIPTSPLQPDNMADGTLVDIWNCTVFNGTRAVELNSSDGRDKWLVTGGSNFEIQSVVTSRNTSKPKCLSYATPARLRVTDCADARDKGFTEWFFSPMGELVNSHSGLCLEVHVDKYAPLSFPSNGCKDTGDVLSGGGGGCVDLVACASAAPYRDNRTIWSVTPSCASTWSQCSGGGLEATTCCEPEDRCVRRRWGHTWDYHQCEPRKKNTSLALEEQERDDDDDEEEEADYMPPGLTWYDLSVTDDPAKLAAQLEEAALAAVEHAKQQKPGAPTMLDPVQNWKYQRVDAKNLSEGGTDGCINAAFQGADAALQACTESAECEMYGTNRLASFRDRVGVNSYINVHKCIGAQNGTNVTSTCAVGVDPATYWQCIGSGSFSNFAEYVLPPYAIAQACETIEVCVGFVVTTPYGDRGTLFTAKVDATSEYSIKKIPPAPLILPATKTRRWASRTAAAPIGSMPASSRSRALGAEAPAPPPPMPDMPGFVQVSYGLKSSSVTRAFEPCGVNGSDTRFSQTLLKRDTMLTLCAQNPGLCTHFSEPSVNITSGEILPDQYWEVTFRAPDSTATYISLNRCKIFSAECGGRFLNCSIADLDHAPQAIERYDLPVGILAEACVAKNCDFFTVERNNANGTLYMFVASQYANVTTNSYFLLGA